MRPRLLVSLLFALLLLSLGVWWQGEQVETGSDGSMGPSEISVAEWMVESRAGEDPGTQGFVSDLESPGEMEHEPRRFEVRQRWWEGLESLEEAVHKGADGGALTQRIVWLESRGKPALIEVFREGEDGRSRLVSAKLANQWVLAVEGLEGPEELERIASALEMRVERVSRSGRYAVLETDRYGISEYASSAVLVSELARELGLTIEPNYLAWANEVVPNDPYFRDRQWGLYDPHGGKTVNATEAWELRTDASDVVVAIIDSGIRTTHEDLAANLWKNAGEVANNGVDDDGNGYVDDVNGVNLVEPDKALMDDDGHGTHVAGIAGAVGNNGKGIAGVAWRVKLMGLKALDEEGLGTNEDIAEAIDYAVEQGVGVINMSLGSSDASELQSKALERSRDAGIVVVASAGNDAAENARHYPSGYDLENIVSVGSYSEGGGRSSFSNFGAESVDLFAPGDSVFSTYAGNDADYDYFYGTSMAAPHVSGAIALAKSLYPNENYIESILRLRLTVGREDPFDVDSAFGGILDLAAFLALEDVKGRPRVLGSSALSRLVYEGSSVAWEAEFYSDSEVTYQWYHGEVALEGEAAGRLELSAVSVEQAGVYTLVATNENGSTELEFSLKVMGEREDLRGLVDETAGRVSVLAGLDGFWESEEDALSEGGSHLASGAFALNEAYRLAFRVRGPREVRFDGRFGYYWNRFRNIELTIDGEEQWIGNEGRWRSYAFELAEDRDYLFELEVSQFSEDGDALESVAIDRIRTYALGEAPPMVNFISGDFRIRPTESGRLEAFQDGEGSIHWEKDGEALQVESSRTLFIWHASQESEGIYRAIGRNANGEERSRRYRVVVPADEEPANIDYGDGSYTNFEFKAGQTAVLSIPHSGTPPLSYSWSYRGDVLDGETGANLIIPAVRAIHAGGYRFTVSNRYGSSTQTLGVTVIPLEAEAPRVVDYEGFGPVQRYWEGDRLDMWFQVDGIGPFDLQWYKDGIPLEGDTGNQISIAALDEDDAGEYVLEARSQYGTARSQRTMVWVGTSRIDELDMPGLEWELPYGGNRPHGASEETKDGEDAMRFEVLEERSYEKKFVMTRLEGPANYSFWWKRSNEEGLFECLIEDDKEKGRLAVLDAVGEWVEGRIHVPAGAHRITWKYSKDETREDLGRWSGSGWLDMLSVTEAPAFVRPEQGVALMGSGRGKALLSAWAPEGVRYRWFKNGEVLEGETSEVLEVEREDFVDTDRFALEIESAAGSLRSKSIRFVELNSLFTGKPVELIRVGDSVQATVDGGGRVIGVKGERADVSEAWLEFELEGPASALLRTNRWGVNSGWKVLVDGEPVSKKQWNGDPRNFIIVERGTHLVRVELDEDLLRIDEDYYHSYWDGLLSIDVGERTRFFGVPDVVNPFDGNSHWVQFGFTTTSEYNTTWLLNGEESPLQDGFESYGVDLFYYPFDPSRWGELSLRVEDADGGVYETDPIVVLSPEGGYPELLDYSNGVEVLGGLKRFADKEVKAVGESSLRIEKQTEEDQSNIHLSLGEPGLYRFQLKGGTESDGVKVRIYDPIGRERVVTLGQEWQAVELLGRSHSLYFEFPEEIEVGFTMWLDGVEREAKPVFLGGPYDHATYLGADLLVTSEVVSQGAMTYQWRKGGVPIEGATNWSLRIESVGFDDLGSYDLVCANEAGQTLSRTFELGLANDLGAAIGQPGLKITTWGDALWQVDESKWLTGGSSLLAGSLERGERSGLRIDFEHEVYLRYAFESEDGGVVSDDFEGSRWNYGTAHNKRASFDFEYVRYGNSPQTRVDALEFLDANFFTYDRWAEALREQGPVSGEDDPWGRFEDLDGDGIVNWMEFALGLDPLNWSDLPHWEWEMLGEEMYLSIGYKEVRSGDARVLVEISSDLEKWHALDLRGSFSEIEDEPFYRRVDIRQTLTTEDAGQLFYRFRVIGLGIEETSDFKALRAN